MGDLLQPQTGQGGIWVKPIAAIAQIVSGMRALVWTELATDHSKHARLTLGLISREYLDRGQVTTMLAFHTVTLKHMLCDSLTT